MTNGPHIGPDVVLDNPAYIDETARLHGKVHVGKDASFWPYSVTRAEMQEIKIGAMSNIQDHVMIHVGYRTPTIVGENCSITHHVTLHGCDIGDNCLIGINSTIMDGAVIGEGSIVAGNSMVTEGAEFEPHSIIAGVPAKVIKQKDNSTANRINAKFYYMIAKNMAKGIERLSDENLAELLQEFAEV